jgi:hypothetical protein
MRRDNEFDKTKVMSISTAKTVTNVYFDSFAIEQVRFSNAEYATKKHADAYVDFSDMAILYSDAESGRLFTQLENAGRLTISLGGSAHSKKFNGAPESRIFEIAKNPTKAGYLYVNISSGKGKLSQTGMIMPDGAPETKIGVNMTYKDFRKMVLYTNEFITAYLAGFVNKLVKEAEVEREQAVKEGKIQA